MSSLHSLFPLRPVPPSRVREQPARPVIRLSTVHNASAPVPAYKLSNLNSVSCVGLSIYALAGAVIAATALLGQPVFWAFVAGIGR